MAWKLRVRKKDWIDFLLHNTYPPNNCALVSPFIDQNAVAVRQEFIQAKEMIKKRKKNILRNWIWSLSVNVRLCGFREVFLRLWGWKSPCTGKFACTVEVVDTSGYGMWISWSEASTGDNIQVSFPCPALLCPLEDIRSLIFQQLFAYIKEDM